MPEDIAGLGQGQDESPEGDQEQPEPTPQLETVEVDILRYIASSHPGELETRQQLLLPAKRCMVAVERPIPSPRPITCDPQSRRRDISAHGPPLSRTRRVIAMAAGEPESWLRLGPASRPFGSVGLRPGEVCIRPGPREPPPPPSGPPAATGRAASGRARCRFFGSVAGGRRLRRGRGRDRVGRTTAEIG